MLDTALSRRHVLPGGRSFRLLLTSLAASSCGDWLYNVALLALVYGRTGSATVVALTTAARVAPIVVLGPLAGALADRHDRRRLIIASDLSRALLMVALAFIAAAGLPIVLVPLLAALATAAGTVQPPCVAACTAGFVPGADLQRANALRASVGQGAVVVGPALGSLLLLASSPSIAILLNAVTFLASAAAIAAIDPHPAFRAARERDAAMPSLLADVVAGARALQGAPTAVKLVAADVLCSAVYGFLTVTLVLISHRLGTGDGGYGVLLGSFGAGGVVGATVAGRAGGPLRWRPILIVALLLVGLTLAALGSAPTLAAAVALSVVCGGGMVVGEVLSETALPRMLDDDVLGRAYGLVLPTSLAGIVAGSLVAGPLVSLVGLQGALAMAGLSVLIVAALLLRRPIAASAHESTLSAA
jgi:MFS family permease